MSKINWASKMALVAMISATVAGTAYADGLMKPVTDALSDDGEAFDVSNMILGDDSAYDFGGWVAAGASSNSTGLFNNYSGFQVSQFWFYAEKAIDTSEGFDWGFRGDVMIGTDYDDTNSFGNNPDVFDQNIAIGDGTYGFAAPQLYVELGYKDWVLKGGKFYTHIGYEVVTAPDNFFFSHAFTMYNSEPFTHTGATLTYSGIDNVDIMVGYSAGWDTGFDQRSDGNTFLGMLSLALTDNTTLIYGVTAGNMGALGEGYSHSFVVDTQVTEKLNYVIQSDYTDIDAVAGEPDSGSSTAGVNQYLFYTVNDTVSLGTRVEWWRTNLGDTPAELDTYAATVGANLQLLPNLRMRPEFRYQFEEEPAFGDQNNPSMAESGIFGIDFILTY